MKKIILLLIVTLLIVSCGWEQQWQEEEKVKKNEIIKSFENPSNDLEKEINENEANLKDEYESKLRLIQSYLKYWDAYFKENIFADKALNILNWMEEDSKVNYFKWYAYEIKTKYEEALAQYEKVLSYDNLDITEKVNVLNQKGHIFDLKWDMEEANKYYLEAEILDPEDIKTLVNRWRYEIRAYNYKASKKYFEKVLEKTTNKYLKSEMYYNLSIIHKENYELDKAIENAKLWIEENKDYPNNYLALWNLYIIKWWEDLDKAPENLNKSIELYPNSSISYKFLWIYYYKIDDFDKAIINFKKQVELSKIDILLMADAKLKTQIAWEYDLARTYALKSDLVNSVKYLKTVLNWENKSYYSWFLVENVDINWAFKSILDEELYKKEVKDILIKYNKK